MRKLKAIGTIWRAWQDSLPREFADSLVDLALYSQAALCKPGEFINYGHSTVSWFETMRQEAVDHSLGDWILMLDTDHQFAPDLLERLLYVRDKHKARVVGALYVSKHPPMHVPVANLWGPNGEILPLIDFDQNKELIEIGPMGAGALLVNRDVFPEMASKFPNQLPFGTIPGLSEDYSFFKRCKDLAIKTYLAPAIEAQHLGPRISLAIRQVPE